MTTFIDLHCHPPVREYLEGPFAPYLGRIEEIFRRPMRVMEPEELADFYRAADGRAVLLGWDAETTSGLPPFTSAQVAALVAVAPEVFIGFGGIDPLKPDAIAAVDTAADLGMVGLKFHPSVQRFDPADPRHDAVFDRAAELGLVCLFHTGYTALGSGMPGGAGVETSFANPMRLDSLAARHPELRIIAAHPSWPWQDEAIATARHKPSVWLELSGWSPRLFPANLVEAVTGELSHRSLFGSDFPFITPQKWIGDWERLGLPAEITRRVLHDNAVALLGLS
jgi:predicted TIM-barrel fold metal-dependent hydrolase